VVANPDSSSSASGSSSGSGAAGASQTASARGRLFSGLRVVIASTLASRVLGMVRDMATATLFGVGPVMDAFSIAFRIPNLARRLFGEGALSTAFLPVFTRELRSPFDRGPDTHPEMHGPSTHADAHEMPLRVPESAWQLANSVFCLLAVVLGGLVLLGEAGLWLASFVFPEPGPTRLLLGLTAVMLPYALLICLAAQVSAVLHATGQFTRPAMVPLVLNLCWIAGVWLIAPWFKSDHVRQAYALAGCIVLAGCLQLGLQWPALRRLGFRFRWRWNRAQQGFSDVVMAIIPVTLGLSITQINTLFDSMVAWTFSRPNAAGPLMNLPFSLEYPLDAGAVSTLYYGERIYQFPVGVFGVALGTVLFPLLARHAARGEFDRLREDLSLGLRLVLLVGIPASAGLILVASPLTRVVFEHGEFSADDARRTAAMIAAYGAGVWAYCAIPMLYRGFYATGDRTTPVRIGMGAAAIDVVLNLVLIWPFAEQGLAGSTAISAIIHTGWLTWAVQKRVGRLDWGGLRRTLWRTIVATGFMSAACAGTIWLLPDRGSRWTEIAALLGPVAGGIVVYLLAARCLALDEIWLLFRHKRTPDEPGPSTEPPPPLESASD
jgi:putative peptidoglycan lipid II flippase